MVAFKKAKDTPAEQLLRMIEGSPPPAAVPEPSSEPSPPPASPMAGAQQVVEALRSRARMAWRGLLPARRELDPFLWNVRVAHRVLWVVLIALAVFGSYTLMDVMMSSPQPKGARIVMSAHAPQGAANSTEGSPSTLKALPDYMAMTQGRNPFTGDLPGVSRSSSKTTKQHLEELVKGLSVVGIDRGANPVALIEHGGQQKTYMVKVGDELNGMVVKSIASEGVTVTYEGQEFLLQ
jgi:hypothetical protein